MNDSLRLGPQSEEASALTAAILTEESRRELLQEARERRPRQPRGVLPGVGDSPLSLRSGLRVGGRGLVVVVFLLAVMEEVDRIVVVSLAPDIQRAFNIGDTVLLGILGFGALVTALGSLPMAWLAGRAKRVRLLAVASVVWSLFSVFSALAVNVVQFFGARLGVAVGRSARYPLHGPLLADRYPIGVRARVFAFQGLGRPVGILAFSVLIGLVAASVAGLDGWRLVIIGAGIPPALVGLAALRFVKEPERFANERSSVLPKTPDAPSQDEDPPVPVFAAITRLRRIKSLHLLCLGAVGAGFVFVAMPTHLSLLLDVEYGYDAFRRGWVISLTWLLALPAVPLAGRLYDKLYRRNPERLQRTAGALVCLAGVLVVAAFRFEYPVVLISLLALANGCLAAALAAAGPIISGVAPYKLRAVAFALFSVFFFGVGGFFTGVITGTISSVHGERMAVSVLGAPLIFLSGMLLFYGSRYMRADMGYTAGEMREEHEELRRARSASKSVPLLWVHGIDAGYGDSQVLFDVGFNLRRGEAMALVGSNSSGRSTLMRTLGGLLLPSRGFVRLEGRNITFLSTESRFKLGMVQMRGGAGVFRDLTVEDNLSAAVMRAELDRSDIAQRRERVLSFFPFLAERMASSAGDLSGGQQQMLALAMVLMHEPRLLLIDELSLGLAPGALADLLDVLASLKEQGQSMLIVDRSVQSALKLADRALFLEKGRVRFCGPAEELRSRSDLLRLAMMGSSAS